MRHLNSLLLSLILGPSIWLLTGYGLVAYGQAGTQADGQLSTDRLVGLGALLVAGILLAWLVLARLSPLGPTVAGLCYLAAAGWVAAYPVLVRHLATGLPVDVGRELIRPAEGYAVLLGVPLFATVFSARRWRRFDAVPALYAGPAEPAPVSAPAYPLAAPTTPAAPGPWSQPAYWGPPAAQQPAPAGYGRPGAAGPAGFRARDDDTDDLSGALLPLRLPPPAAG